MKKTVGVVLLASTLVLTGAYQALAYMGMEGENGPVSAHMGMAGPAQMDKATKLKFKAFQKETNSLRKSMVVKRAEKKALMRAENPDAQRVAVLAGEIFDIRSELQLKAEKAGLGKYIGRGNHLCGNQRMGHGREHRPQKNQ